MARRGVRVNACHFTSRDFADAGTGRPPGAFPNVTRIKSVARLDNVVFLSPIGETLRWATQDVAREELPPDVRRLLGRLERLEARRERKNADGSTEPANS
jgi:hypothetical protein